MSHGTLLKRESAICFDAGSRYCPCELAVLGQCVACSCLRGEDTCRCGWSGLCIASQFAFNGSRASAGRASHRASVIRRMDLNGTSNGPKAFFLSLAVPRELAAWSVFPGSFVMLRAEGASERWNVPLCVMRAKDSYLDVLIEVQGPKTVALDRVAVTGAGVNVTGPFWSGIQGMEHIRNRAAGPVLAVAKGVGQAALLPVAEYVADRGGSLKALIGPGPLGSTFSMEALTALGASVEVMPRESDHNLGRVTAELEGSRYGLLFSSGSEEQHRGMVRLLMEVSEPPKFAWSSNLTMTCAEGICGSCLSQGFRGCKAQIPERHAWAK